MPRRATPASSAARRRRGPAKRQPRGGRASPYHHGDLARALLEEGLRTIKDEGVGGLTLRRVGERLGVSRTALYRHFASKQALLAVVAAEGFRTLKSGLQSAYEGAGRGQAGFDAMGLAYVRFAVDHPSHYRVMFGGYVTPADLRAGGGDVAADAGTDAFQVLVDALVEQQAAGLVRSDEPRLLAVFIWSVVHGVAMLALDGMLNGNLEPESLMRYANERLRGALAPVAGAL